MVRFTSVKQFTSDNVKLRGQSSYGEAVANDTKNIDFDLSFTACLTGAQLIVKGGKIEDKISLQIVHPLAGVLSEFITDWFISEDSQRQFMLDIPFPANLPSGLKIRAVYKATEEEGTRDILINWHLYEVISGPVIDPNQGKNTDPEGTPPEDQSLISELPPSSEEGP